VLIAVVIGAGAAAFAYTAGWFSPQRLTPGKLVAAFAPPTGAALGHRRNHAKGICFTGVFEADGAGSELSQARVFVNGQYPVLGRFNLGTASPNAPDATVRVRGLALRISTPDGQEWRSAMIDPPVFTVATPEAFYELLRASGSKDPNAMETFAAAHPEFATFAIGRRTDPGPEATLKIGSTASTVSSSSTAPAWSMWCAGRCCQRRNRLQSRPMNLRNADPIFSSRRSLSASPARRNGGPWW
jgi:catalase